MNPAVGCHYFPPINDNVNTIGIAYYLVCVCVCVLLLGRAVHLVGQRNFGVIIYRPTCSTTFANGCKEWDTVRSKRSKRCPWGHG